MPTRVAVDICGTFTDLVHLEAESGAVGATKAPTTPRRFEDGAVDRACRDAVGGDSGRPAYDPRDFDADPTSRLAARAGATASAVPSGSNPAGLI
jgi:Hydantoinase/oxoprolinase N-terminal region